MWCPKAMPAAAGPVTEQAAAEEQGQSQAGPVWGERRSELAGIGRRNTVAHPSSYSRDKEIMSGSVKEQAASVKEEAEVGPVKEEGEDPGELRQDKEKLRRDGQKKQKEQKVQEPLTAELFFPEEAEYYDKLVQESVPEGRNAWCDRSMPRKRRRSGPSSLSFDREAEDIEESGKTSVLQPSKDVDKLEEEFKGALSRSKE